MKKIKTVRQAADKRARIRVCGIAISVITVPVSAFMHETIKPVSDFVNSSTRLSVVNSFDLDEGLAQNGE